MHELDELHNLCDNISERGANKAQDLHGMHTAAVGRSRASNIDPTHPSARLSNCPDRTSREAASIDWSPQSIKCSRNRIPMRLERIRIISTHLCEFSLHVRNWRHLLGRDVTAAIPSHNFFQELLLWRHEATLWLLKLQGESFHFRSRISCSLPQRRNVMHLLLIRSIVMVHADSAKPMITVLAIKLDVLLLASIALVFRALGSCLLYF